MGTRWTFTGRLVQGDPSVLGPAQKDDRTGQPKVTREGQPIRQFFAALAIPKDPGKRIVIPGNPTYEQAKALIDAEARQAWPQFFGTAAAGVQIGAHLPAGCTNPKFANKIVDGDGFDEKGQPNSAKEGWAGCWIVKSVTMFAPKIYEWTHTGWQETQYTGRKIKCGDFLTIAGDCVSNESQQTAGMYMNMDTVSFEQEGPFIASVNTVDPNQALGSRGAPPAGQGQGGAGGQPDSAGAGHTGGNAAGTNGSGTASEPGPYSGYRDPAAGNGAVVPPPPDDGPTMTAKATATYDQYKAAGWTDKQLQANGLMV